MYNKPGICKKIFKSVHQATGGHIKLFIAGGAAIDPRVIEDFEAMGFPMIQGYGMTENAPIIAVNRDRCSKAAAAGFPIIACVRRAVCESPVRDVNGIPALFGDVGNPFGATFSSFPNTFRHSAGSFLKRIFKIERI